MKKQAKFVVYQDTANEWRWRLVAKNGRTIADSAEGYKEQRKAVAATVLVSDSLRDEETKTHIEAETLMSLHKSGEI